MCSFSDALDALKDGCKVARKGWNGKGMFIYLVQGTTVSVPNLRNEAQKHVGMIMATADKVEIKSHIDMKASDGSIAIGWTPSQTDMLSEDWEVLK